MILHSIIGSPREQLGNHCPLVAMCAMGKDHHRIFPFRKRLFLHLWVQLIAPAQPAALPRSANNAARNHRPILRTVLHDQSSQQLVLLLSMIFDQSQWKNVIRRKDATVRTSAVQAPFLKSSCDDGVFSCAPVTAPRGCLLPVV